jgi:hypothetical protein
VTPTLTTPSAESVIRYDRSLISTDAGPLDKTPARPESETVADLRAEIARIERLLSKVAIAMVFIAAMWAVAIVLVVT